MEQQKQRAEQQRLSPFLQAEDWVVITIDSLPLPPGQPADAGSGRAGCARLVLRSQQQNILAQSGAGSGGEQALSASWAVRWAALALLIPSRTAWRRQPRPRNGAVRRRSGRDRGRLRAAAAPLHGTAELRHLRSLRRPELTDEEKKQRQALIDLIRSKNPYQLSRDGVLALPGFAPIPSPDSPSSSPPCAWGSSPR